MLIESALIKSKMNNNSIRLMQLHKAATIPALFYGAD